MRQPLSAEISTFDILWFAVYSYLSYPFHRPVANIKNKLVLLNQRDCILEVEKELYEIIHVNPVMSGPDFFYQLEKFYQSESTHWIWLGFVNKAQETSINHTTSVKRFTMMDV